jgi:hypothetical protein
LWEDAVQRWGSSSSSLADVLAPAIELAEGGFPVGPVASFEWQKGAEAIREVGGAGVRALITEEGCGPQPGQIWRNTDLAATLRRLAEHGAAKGRVAAAGTAGSSVLHDRLIRAAARQYSWLSMLLLVTLRMVIMRPRCVLHGIQCVCHLHLLQHNVLDLLSQFPAICCGFLSALICGVPHTLAILTMRDSRECSCTWCALLLQASTLGLLRTPSWLLCSPGAA